MARKRITVKHGVEDVTPIAVNARINRLCAIIDGGGFAEVSLALAAVLARVCRTEASAMTEAAGVPELTMRLITSSVKGGLQYDIADAAEKVAP